MMNNYYPDKSGLPLTNNSDNVRFFLKTLALEIRWNSWTEQIEIRSGNSLNPTMQWPQWARLDDAIISRLISHAHRSGTDFHIGKDFLWHVLMAMAHAKPYDPVLEIFEKLENEWDGVERADRWLVEACGVPDDGYHRAVGRLILGGIVMRARKPGCKFDFMPIFYGPQGHLKSTMAKVLALVDEWFTDVLLLGTESKELVLALAGILVAEVSEMGTRSSAGVNHVKAMVSRQVDRGRTAYARVVTDRPRRNIFIGTVNDAAPLSDPTGNRRFLPIAINQEIDIEWLSAHIGQLYGEIAAAESAGETFALPREVWSAAADAQNAVTEEPTWKIYFSEWFAPTDLNVFITPSDLATLAKEAASPRSVSSADYVEHMKKLGFTSHVKRLGGKNAKVWARGDVAVATRIVPQRDAQGRWTPRIEIIADGSYVPTQPAPPFPTPQTHRAQ